MPPTLRPLISRSLGHLVWADNPVTAAIASRAATAARNGSAATVAVVSGGRSRIEQ
jgi:hypothetical protein